MSTQLQWTSNSYMPRYYYFEVDVTPTLKCDTGWPKKNNTETNHNDTDTNDIFGKSLMHNYL